MTKPVPKPLWNKLTSGLKQRSRKWFIERAERLGVPWETITNTYDNSIVFYNCVHKKEDIENLDIRYPDYYTKPFHGYDRGNLNWQAAFEAEAATLSISSNYWKGVDPYTSEQWLRHNITKRIDYYRSLHDIDTPKNILDIGCSTGISTEFLRNQYKSSTMWGVDLSPYFLAVAKHRNDRDERDINYVHANAEKLPFSDNSMDMITLHFVLHEVPQDPTYQILQEAYRVLKPEGTIFIIDLEPEKLQQTLSTSRFRRWAFEVTEPHIYPYYKNSMSGTLISNGFVNVVKYPNDPINSIWCGIKKEQLTYNFLPFTQITQSDKSSPSKLVGIHPLNIQ